MTSPTDLCPFHIPHVTESTHVWCNKSIKKGALAELNGKEPDSRWWQCSSTLLQLCLTSCSSQSSSPCHWLHPACTMANISSLHTSATLTCITESIIRPDCSSKTICVVLTIGVFGCKQVSGVLCLVELWTNQNDSGLSVWSIHSATDTILLQPACSQM